MTAHTQLTAEVVPAPWELAQLPPETPVLLALSGGADSRALLHLLAAQAARDGFPLLTAHVDHGIRGEESKRDRRFCEELVSGYGLEIRTLEVDVPALAAAHGRGLEEEAREVRYAFFERVMEEERIPLLVTAHHGDDHLETVLFRMGRGTGLKGLCGIAPTRPFAKGVLVRPLLAFSRKQILEYCDREGLEFVTDSTNGDEAYARNCIRNRILPAMEALFEHPQRQVRQMSDSLREDEDCLSQMAAAFLDAHCHSGVLEATSLTTLHPAVRKRVWMQWILRQTGHGADAVHLEALNGLLTHPTADTQVALRGGCFAVAEGSVWRILGEKQTAIPPFEAPFSMGSIAFSKASVRILAETVKNGEKDTKVHNLSTATHIILNVFSDIIISGLFWRSRCDGDVIRINGMNRRLRKLYNAAGIPPRMRDRIPLLCDAQGIVWAPYIGVRDGIAFDGAPLRITVLFDQETNLGMT